MSLHDHGRSLPPRSQLTIAISAALAGTQTPVAHADEALEEIIVTARKRAENLQDIPQSIQAIPSDLITRAGLQGLEDTARFIPSVSYVAQAPGANKLIFRGVADTNRSFYSDTSAAIYLDEQPLTLPSQTPEPRQVDIERIEALAGPQGTLYGGSAQSGTLRIVTNKPDPTRFETIADATVMKGATSDFSYDVSGVLNVPLIPDKLAIRLVGFSATDGGFIDNVLGHVNQETARADRGPGISGDVENSGVVKKNASGEADYLGGRATLRWLPNPDWAVTTGVVFQDLDSEGNYDHEPGGKDDPDPSVAGNLNKVRFLEESREDTWTQLGLTLEGDLGFAQLVSATSYFTRDIFYHLDNTAYATYLRNFYVNYTAINGFPSYVNYALGDAPVGLGWINPQDTRRFSQEIRLSHEGQKWAWIAGLFYEHLHDHWDFKAKLEDYETTKSFTEYWVNYGAVPGTSENTYWNNNNKTKTDHLAAFGELTHHLNDQWSFTGGARLFTHKRDRTYFVAQPANNVLQFSETDETTSDIALKASVQYRFDDRRMAYFLYSEGFRNGGGNIIRPQFAINRPEFEPDFLQNYEFGLKSRWLDDRVQANITLFHLEWDDFQTEVTDPPPGPFGVVVVNAGDATIDGAEVQLSVIPVEGLELEANFQNLFTAELNEDLEIPAGRLLYRDGARLAIAPDFKAFASIQYTWQRQFAGGNPYARIQYSYQDEALSDLECNTANCDTEEVMDSYAIADAKIGLEGDSWEVSLFVDNFTDEQAELYATRVAGTPSTRLVTVNRPREYGLRFMKKWGD